MNPATPLQPEVPEDCTISLVGLGGVGGIVARYLALFLAARAHPARLVLIDGDTFEPGNAARMFFLNPGNKAASIRDELLDRFAASTLTVLAVESYLDESNIATLLRGGLHHVILLCVDNHATRKLVNDHCATLPDVCLISGGNDPAGPDNDGRILRGSFGNCQVYIRRGGRDETPSLTRFHPEIENPRDRIPNAQSCVEAVLSTPQILFANLQVATCMLTGWFLYACRQLPAAEIGFDLAEGVMRPMPIDQPRWPAGPAALLADDLEPGLG